MINPADFKAPYIPRDKVWEQADRILDQYWPSRNIPVEVFEIVEFDIGLRIETVSGLKRAADVDALLLGDLKTIIVDWEEFLDDRAQNRMRFSVAHELGHFILHSEVIRQLRYGSVNEWIATIQALPDDQYRWLEQHAYEFAGRLLVPPLRLRDAFSQAIHQAKEHGFTNWDSSGDTGLEYVAQSIGRSFRVSGEVIERRLKREGMWPPSQT
jgi:hypothetical protein